MDCSCNIVLVDDDSDDQFIFSEAYEELNKNHTLCTFNNGKEFCNYLFGLQNYLPNLIFLDLNMPLMNGMDCLKAIRNEEQYNDVSVVMYSTSDRKDDIKQTFEMGANFYLKKPDNYSQLKSLMGKAMSYNYVGSTPVPYEQYILSA